MTITCLRHSLALSMLVALLLTACATSEPASSYERTPLPDRSYDGDVIRSSDEEAVDTLDRPARPEEGMMRVRLLYPDAVREAGLEPRIVVTFVVGPDGLPYDVAVERELSEAAVQGLSEEAREGLKDMEHQAKRTVWSTEFAPATVNGEPVAVQMTWPLSFRAN